MSDAKRSARVESSDASAKKEMWFSEGKDLIRLVRRVDSTQHDLRGAGTADCRGEGGADSPSDDSNIPKSIIIDLSSVPVRAKLKSRTLHISPSCLYSV